MVPPLLDVDGPSSSSDVPRRHRSDDAIASKHNAAAADRDRVEDANDVAVSFSHVHLYADSVEDLESYKDLEDRLNALSVGIIEGGCRGGTAAGEKKLDVKSCRSIWRSICGSGSDEVEGNKANAEVVVEEETFVPQNRDVVRQLLSGFGFRVTGKRFGPATRSVLVTSRDPRGVQIVVTARADAGSTNEAREVQEGGGGTAAGARKEGEEEHLHFDAANVATFLSSHSNRQGVAVLAFEVTAGSISSIHSRYLQSHPLLLPSEYTRGPVRYDDGRGADVLEVYAYYRGEKRDSTADVGTRLRFVQRIDGGGGAGNGGESTAGGCILPGLDRVEATFDAGSKAAYCDHWVSNVVSRTGFLDTLRETLGFTPKVDFNAGVVAAGEAQIESTVTGNDPTAAAGADSSSSRAVAAASTGNGGIKDEGALTDQTQVYLPINNALSEVGHVHGFLRELGQGVQHVASRVDDLVSFVQRGNDYRKITGEGFTFLNIPRSYYGVLSADVLQRKDDGLALSAPCAAAVVGACEKSGMMSGAGEVDLDATAEDVSRALDKLLPQEHREEYESNEEMIVAAVLRSRYANLRRLLGRHLSDESYMGIVRNQILVDVQGEDLLFQIFTCNVLQRNAGDEAPFFEFIQRVCSECLGPDGCPLPVKPGCGGFGIRNFLTLFLSIEVSKAMLDAVRFKSEGNDFATSIAQRRVQLFTDQLNESNPILTSISDAMTAEGKAEAAMNAALARRKNGDADRAADSEAEVEMWRERLAAAGRAKGEGNERLMKCSAKYNRLMRDLREEEEEELRGKK